MNAIVRKDNVPSRIDAEAMENESQLRQACQQVLSLCDQHGVDQAQVKARASDGLEVGVRLGEVEKLIRKRDRELTVVVQVNGSQGEASTGDLGADALRTTVEKACAIAARTEADACNGLVDPALHPRELPDMDLWHPWEISPQQAIALARETEVAGRSTDARIVNSNGASVESGTRILVHANSQGFIATQRRSMHELSASFIASDGGGMQRGQWFDVACAPEDLRDAESIGRRAAHEALQRLGARPLPTRQCPVLLVPEVAAGLIQHLLSALRGGALYRRASFLIDAVGTPLFPDFIDIDECPHLPRGLASRAFDDDGVATQACQPLVRDGVLQRYLLDEYSARRLGLRTTGNAGGTGNVVVAPGKADFASLLKQMHDGLVVTGVMGQGVSLVSGDYSRGAWGLRVENGEIAGPVEEITIASNLKDMFAGIVAAGSDVDVRFGTHTGSLLIERMTVAGK
ncbi:MAG: metallopeptidase TldD-related protein [Pseudoxanthomonas sp.]